MVDEYLMRQAHIALHDSQLRANLLVRARSLDWARAAATQECHLLRRDKVAAALLVAAMPEEE